MVCTTNIAPPYLCTTIAQHSASIVQMVNDLPSNLRSARNRRLKIFALVNDFLDDHDALITHVKYIWGAICIVQKWQQPAFSRERYKND